MHVRDCLFLLIYTDPSSSTINKNRDLLLGCLAVIGRELVMREANAQIATLPPAVQEKSYRLMNRTVANLQDKVGGCFAHVLVGAVLGGESEGRLGLHGCWGW